MTNTDSLAAHLQELRTRLLISLGAWLIASMCCYLIIEPIMGFLTQPLAQAFEGQSDKRLIFTSLPEAFVTYIKLAMFCGFLTSFPVIASQCYRFLAPGLYAKEKRAVYPFIIAAPLLFYAGAALAYFFIFPLAWQFFASFEINAFETQGLPVELEAKISEYLALVRAVVLAFGLAFQLPIGLVLLVRAGLIKVDTLAKGRRYAIIAMLTAAAVLTPPDIISQIGLFSALYLLYECAIIAARLVERKRNGNSGT